MDLDQAAAIYHWQQESSQQAIRELFMSSVGENIFEKNVRTSAASLAFAAWLNAVKGLGFEFI